MKMYSHLQKISLTEEYNAPEDGILSNFFFFYHYNGARIYHSEIKHVICDV